jgi:signal transduction histidine kinase
MRARQDAGPHARNPPPAEDQMAHPDALRRLKDFLALHALGVTLTAATFVFDVMTPLGVASGVPYALLVLLSLRSPDPGLTWFAAISGTVLSILGSLLSAGEATWTVLANRILALFVIWVTAALCLNYKRQARELERDRQVLAEAEKMASLGGVASGIAHELGTPLATIHGRMRMLEKKLDTGSVAVDEVRRVVRIVDELTERMTRIIRGMTSVTRNADGDPFERTSVARIARDVVELGSERAVRLGIDLRLRVDGAQAVGPALHAPCRETQVGQVLVNLINNAFDAVVHLPERWIEVSVEADEQAVHLAVTDSGSGLSPELRDKVMAPFFTTKPAGKGTGLGLAISRSIAEAHHGALWIDDACPHTRFVLSLPRTRGGREDTRM